jgi:ubiquinone biosynthesis protein
LFVTGFFHGDPHPGNLIFLPDSRIAYVDFGIFGEFTDREREIWRKQFEAFALGDIRESIYQYSRLVIADPDGDLVAFQREAYESVQSFYLANLNPETPPEERHIGRSSAMLFELLQKHRLRVTLNNLLFWRTLVALNASAFRLSPRFDLLGTQREFFARYRPDPVEEMLDLVRKNIEERIMFQRDGQAEKINQALSISSQGALKLDVGLSGTAHDERQRNNAARAASLMLVGLSFAVAGGATLWDAPWRLAILVLAIPMFTWSVVRGARR